jgi:glycosyltransferase involved in cell wall biosynthesis
LLSLRDQSIQGFQLVLVDDASTEPASAERRREMSEIAGAGFKLVSLPANVGLAAARNRGLEQVTSPFAVCLDADDVVAQNFLATTIGALRADPSLGFVYFDHFEFGAVHQNVRAREFDFRQLLRQNYVVAPSPFRLDAWKKAGGYREEMRRGYEDWEFWIRLAKQGWRGKRLRQTLFYYRKRPESLLAGTLRSHEDVRDFIRRCHPDLDFETGRPTS